VASTLLYFFWSAASDIRQQVCESRAARTRFPLPSSSPIISPAYYTRVRAARDGRSRVAQTRIPSGNEYARPGVVITSFIISPHTAGRMQVFKSRVMPRSEYRREFKGRWGLWCGQSRQRVEDGE